MKCVLTKLFCIGLMLWRVTPAVAQTAAALNQHDPMLSLHWMGIQQVSRDPNAAEAIQLANLPTSLKLRTQTINKLAVAPWTLTGSPTDEDASQLLRPLVTDLFFHESRLRVSTADGGSTTRWILAIRLNESRSKLWETNLANVLTTLTTAEPAPLADNRAGWKLQWPRPAQATDQQPSSSEQMNTLYLTRSDSWTLLGLAHNVATFDSLSDTVLKEAAPAESPWLSIDADLAWLSQLLGLPPNLIADYPRMDLKVFGREKKVVTEASFRFPNPLELHLDSWNVPTNLMSQPLLSFTACRGLELPLKESAPWQSLGLNQDVKQVFVWAHGGTPMLTYFAATVADPKAFVTTASERVLPNGRERFDSKRLVGFRMCKDGNGFEWKGLPYLYPFLRYIDTGAKEYVHGGAFSYAPVSNPLAPEFYQTALSSSNLVYYGWEQSGHRVAHWLFMGQFIRYASDRSQLPFESAGLLWLKSLQPKLGTSITRIHQIAPNELTLGRSSSVGLTAIELHLLADWLESPEFPRGLHTLVAPAPSDP